MPPEPIDLLIEARWVLPIAPANTVLPDHAVAVSSGKIVGIGPVAQMTERFEARERVVRRDHALLPGFVNAHTRGAPTALLRGLPDCGPAEQRCISADFVREGTQFAVADMLRAGITSFANTYLFPEEAARVASAARMRAAIGLPVADSPNVWADSATAHFERAEQLWDQYRSDPWVCLYFAPQDAAGVSDATLIRVRRVADELDARITMESPPLQRLSVLGLLRPGFAAIPHEIWEPDERELVETTGISVIACLQGDLRLGAVADVSSVVGLGSGDPLSVAAVDMLGEARMAATLGVPALEALRLVTLGGATALGFGNDIGSIEPGKYADLVCVRVDESGFNVPESLLFGATRAQVSDVWTSGRAALGSFDEDELVASAQKWLRIGGAT